MYFISLTSDTKKKNHYHVTHCFSSCAVFAFLRCIYDSLYYGVVALSNIPSKCSERCRVPSFMLLWKRITFSFSLTIILLSSLSVARVNVQDVCSWPAYVY